VKLAIQDQDLVYSDDPKAATVNIGTHASITDGLVMMTAYYRAGTNRHPPCAIVKREALLAPFYGIFAYFVGNVFVARGSGSSKDAAIASMKQCGDRAKQGFAIGAFPEGTRRRSPSVGKEHLMPFKKGTFHMIKSLSDQGVIVDISPFCIVGARSAWSAGRLIPTPGAKITLKFLPHIRLEQNGESPEELIEKTRTSIEKGIEVCARNDEGQYDTDKAFSEGVEVDLMKLFLFEAVLLSLPPILTVSLGVLGML